MTEFFKNLKTRTLVRIITGAAAVILLLIGALLAERSRTNMYRDYTQQRYQHAFSDFVSAVQEMNTSMQKCTFSSSKPMLASTCTDVYAKALSATSSLSQLPLSALNLENTAAFINRVGDYALYLSKAAGRGGITEEERENLTSLQDTAGVLTQNLTDLLGEIQNGNMDFSDMLDASDAISAEDLGAVMSSLSSMEQEFPEVPTLIYDGPFSQHMEDSSPAMLADAAEMSDEELLSSAAAFFSLREQALTPAGEGSGGIKTIFYSASVDGGEMYIEVSRLGGFVLNMFNSRAVYEAVLSPDAAVGKAQQLLMKNGIKSMDMTYYQVKNNILTANFAYTRDGIIFYTDLIKVSVALDTGRVVGYEASGYISNHTSRTLPAVSVPAEEAQSAVSPDLKVLSHALAVIPTDGKSEVFCHEFKCEDKNGVHCLIYVNVETGIEERILILLEDESGTLTI
mgnify:FL=1